MTETDEKDRRRFSVTDRKNPYFNYTKNVSVLRVLPGACMVTGEADDMLATTLGSCVSACIRNPRTGYGGMNHFMLPSNKGKSDWGGETGALRYGDKAMDLLIAEVLKSGCSEQDLEIKVFGGGNVIKSLSSVGSDNADFVLDYLANRGLEPAAQDLGGPYPRRIHYFPATGKVDRLLLRRTDDIKYLDEEKAFYEDCMPARKLMSQARKNGETSDD